ncbi:MAG: lamin tail domain-containing protein [Planctomycetota bacterium]
MVLGVLGLSACGGNKSSKRSSTTSPVTSNSTGNTNSNNTNTGSDELALDVVAATVTESKPAADLVALTVTLSAPATNAAAVEFEGLTITASGTVDESTELGEIKLVGDDNKNGALDAGEPTLGTGAAPIQFQADDGSVSFSVAQAISIAPGADIQLLVVVDASISTAPTITGKTIELGVAAAADVTVTQNGTAITLTGTTPTPAQPITLFVHDHLLISEIVPTPTDGEYIELFNPTAQAIDLTDVFLTDATNQASTIWYYNLPTGAGFAPDNAFDYLVRFPAGAQIQPGQTITVAYSGSGFQATYAQDATYCMRDAAGTTVQMLTADTANPPAWSATPIPGTGGVLTNGGEPTILFRWDGTSDLVQDLDYMYYGTSTAANQRIDKTGVTIDGPDADTAAGAYTAETATFMQPDFPVTGLPTNGIQRVDFTEGAEVQTGGNGITTNDETSEDFLVTFANGTPTPGAP